MDNNTKYTCCFTGHRPSKLPWEYNEKDIRCILFKARLKHTISKAIKHGYTHFISGMALGIDLICAELIISIKEKHPNIKLECAIPCTNQTAKWHEQDILRYNKILKQADKITYVSKTPYTKDCMTKRNKYMVDSSSLLIAAFNGSKGGTEHTIEYAQQQGLNIIILKP